MVWEKLPGQDQGERTVVEYLEMVEEVYRKLVEVQPSQSKTAISYPCYHLNSGSRGEAVKAVQRRLGGLVTGSLGYARKPW